jgi:hypothetical protein
MAKKKNSQFLPGLLEDIMSLLTPEEQEIAFELFNDGANQVVHQGIRWRYSNPQSHQGYNINHPP